MLAVVLCAVALLAGSLALVVSAPGRANPGARATVTPRAAAEPGPAAAGAGTEQALNAAASFLHRYELPNGRVARWDQGGDTVSEGEAYAMLLSVAVGDRSRFDAAWSWTRAHLLLPSGLMAWHWSNGQVTGSEPAADADTDAAYALELAATRFGERSDLNAAAAMASAIVGDESIATPTGRLLVAGPWAVGPPSYVNPSYASPEELTALGDLFADPADFTAMAQGARALVAQLLAENPLPPDWVQAGGASPVAVAPPGQESTDVYGFDAVRLPIRWGASCDAADRHAAAMLWPVLDKDTRPGETTVSLNLNGTRSGAAEQSSVGLVAAAGAAWAADRHGTAQQLLNRAQAMNRAHRTYYSSAWVALGRMFLQTRRLGTCGGA